MNGLFFCGFTYSQNPDSLKSTSSSILKLWEYNLHLNNIIYPENIFLKGTIYLDDIVEPGFDPTISSISGLNDPYIQGFLKEEAMKNNLKNYIQSSAPKREDEVITAIRKYLGISRDIFAVILAVIHIMTY